MTLPGIFLGATAPWRGQAQRRAWDRILMVTQGAPHHRLVGDLTMNSGGDPFGGKPVPLLHELTLSRLEIVRG
jgi:hypothetical protein